jgi:serine/threonine-protein kinase
VQLANFVGQPINTALATLQDVLPDTTSVADLSCTGGLVTEQSLAPGDQPQNSDLELTFCAG